MTEIASIPEIVDLWRDCTGVKLEKIREQMAVILGISDYNKHTFHDKFRRSNHHAYYELDELLALVQAFQKTDPTCVTAYHAIRLFDLARMTVPAFGHLKALFQDEEYDQDWKEYLRTHNLIATVIPTSNRDIPKVADDEKFIVGRDQEVQTFGQFLEHAHTHWIYGIYGPGGIGKSVLAEKFQRYAHSRHIPLAFLNGSHNFTTPSQMLYLIAEGFAQIRPLSDFFAKFYQAYALYADVHELLHQVGGINSIFDVLGVHRTDMQAFTQLMSQLPNGGDKHQLERTFANRFTLETYLRKAENDLIHQLAEGLGAAQEVSRKPLTLLLDTYEEIEGLDNWICTELLPKIHRRVRLTILGRNALTKVSYEWKALGPELVQEALDVLSPDETRAYFMHHGLNDPHILEQLCRYTNGYPLLLVLVCALARDLGGWDQLGSLENEGDQYQIATDLLDRILREERVHEVRAFLEKGVVVDWFNPEIISEVLELPLDDGRAIYDKLRRHSFVERHPNGMKFHDVIREVLLARLTETERNAIRQRVREYFYRKSGQYAG